MEDLKFLAILKSLSVKNSNDLNSHIAKFVLANVGTINQFSLEEIAKKTNTSKPSIIRFCNKVGLSGFSELKFQTQNLKKHNVSMSYQFNFKKELIDKSNFYDRYLEIKSNSSKVVLENYLQKEKEVGDFIKKLNDAKTIYIFGMNLSYNMSRNFVQRIRWLGKTVILERDLNSIESYIEQINDMDVVIILSLSGNSKYLIDFVKKLYQNTFMFGILGKDGEINSYCDLFIDIPHFEDEMWDSFSIRGQCLVQLLDYIYIDLTNFLLAKVQ